MTAVVEAARNVVCSGAEPLGVTDCLNFGNPEKPEIMWQFREAVRGMRDACTALGVPVVSGNVSFYNETDGRPIPPTPTDRAGRPARPTSSHHTTQWFKSEGDVIVLLGRTREELGGSEYLAVVHDLVRGTPPWIDLAVEMQVQQVCLQAIREGAGALGARRVRRRLGGRAGRGAASPGPTSRSAPRSRWRRRSGPMPGCSARASRASCCRCGASTSIALRDLARAADVPLTVLGEVRGRRLRIGSLDRRRRGCRAAPRLGGGAAAPHGGVGVAENATPMRSRCGEAVGSTVPVAPPNSRRVASDAGRLPRRVRADGRLRPSRGGQPRLPRAVRPAASRPGGLRASSPRTATLLLSHRGLGLVADVFDQEILSRLDRLDGHRPQPLLDQRPHAAQEHAALRRRVRARRPGRGAQRQPGQRHRAARAARGARLDLPVVGRHRGDRPPDRRRGGRDARRPRRRRARRRARRLLAAVSQPERADRGARSERFPAAGASAASRTRTR